MGRRRLIGRDDVMSVLPDVMTTERWVALVGPPGSGKTTVLRHLVGGLPDVVWVNARGITRLSELLRACLEALGAPHGGDVPERELRLALDSDPRWLVVDGTDVDDFDEVVAAVMEATSGARVLTTSTSLRPRPGRRVVRLAPFPVPSDDEPLEGPAVELFCRCVVDAGGHPVDLAADDGAVRRMLRASGGLPLLIEQMAAQIALVGVSEVTPTASLSEAVHASYSLLDPQQQQCFRRLSTLTAPVSTTVLAAVTGVDEATGRDLALGLAQRSLVEPLPDGRIDMLVPVRRHGQLLAAGTRDESEARRGLVAWADRVLPEQMNTGAADAEWLADLPMLRAAVATACADDATRAHGYALANRAFSSLYTAMRAGDAAELLETALTSGDGPPEIGAQVARRAGIAASEVRGTYEGLWLLERADQHAVEAADPDLETARTAAIRAEMHLDAGDLARAESEARRVIALDHGTDRVAPQATRTLANSLLVRGDLQEAGDLSRSLLTTRQQDEPWLTLSARLLLARIAHEQGRLLEAVTAARRVREEARELAEERLAVLAEIALGHLGDGPEGVPADDESYPWAVRLPIMVVQASRLLRAGDAPRAAGRAADAVVLADSARLGRDALDARLLLGYALLVAGEEDEARATLLQALRVAAAMPAPLRAADVLDALGHLVADTDPRTSRRLAAAALALRTPRGAVNGGRRLRRVEPARHAPEGWVVGDHLTPRAVHEIGQAVSPLTEPRPDDPLAALTPAEQSVAVKVAEGLTSRQIAADLFLSPRTVDAHLSRIYRKLDINTRARLAALVTGRD